MPVYSSPGFTERRQMATSLHLQAARAVPKFHPNAITRLVNNICPWNPDSGKYGYRYYHEVLLPNPGISVGEAEALRSKLGIRDHFDQGHIRWLYTFVKAPGFPFIEIDGKTYDPKQYDWEPTAPRTAIPAVPAPEVQGNTTIEEQILHELRLMNERMARVLERLEQNGSPAARAMESNRIDFMQRSDAAHMGNPASPTELGTMNWSNWNEARKTQYGPDQQIEVLNPNAHTSSRIKKVDRRERFESYAIYNTVGKYCTNYKAMKEAGRWNDPDSNSSNGMTDIAWDVWKGNIRVV
jgi:hypothetical protein